MQSGHYTYHRTYLPCHHCAALVGWPRWARVDHLRYVPLCWGCFDKIDETFTEEQAICQALIIVGMWQGAHPIGGVR